MERSALKSGLFHLEKINIHVFILYDKKIALNWTEYESYATFYL